MNKKEAQIVLGKTLADYRKKKTHGELLYLLKTQDTFEVEVVAESGTRYQIEIQAFRDDEEKKNLRVIGSIDDGGIRAFFPVTDDFIITRGGDFFL
jgi:hypothetical protein